MSADNLTVDPSVVSGAGATFQQAGSQLAALQAGNPLGTAAAGVAQLATAGACQQAQAAVDAATKALGESTSTLATNLTAAAQHYVATDQASASTIQAAGSAIGCR